MKDLETEFLMSDYSASASLVENYSKMRVTALAGAITLFSALITIPKPDSTVDNIALAILILFVGYCSIRVIGSINSNVYARCLHMEWLELQIGRESFFTHWNKFVPENSASAASNGYLMACHGINVGSAIFAIFSIYNFSSLNVLLETLYYSGIKDLSLYVTLQTAAYLTWICAIIAICYKNNIYIRENLSPAIVIPKLRVSLESVRS